MTFAGSAGIARRSALLAVAAGAFACGASGSLAAPERAATTAGSSRGAAGPTGKVAFAHGGWNRMHIYTMNADGSGLRQLTRGTGTNLHPRWSPDGRRLAYVSRPGMTRLEARAMIMNADGSRARAIVKGAVQVDWSRDGRSLVVFASTPTRLDHPSRTGQLRRPSDDPPPPPPPPVDPPPPPPGDPPPADPILVGDGTLFLVPLDRDGLIPLIREVGMCPYRPNLSPAPNPRRDEIAYVTGNQIRSVGAAGTIRRCTFENFESPYAEDERVMIPWPSDGRSSALSSLSWSPGGDRLAYAEIKGPRGAGGRHEASKVYVVGRAGGRPRLIGRGTFPTWTPDGQLVFVENRTLSRWGGIRVVPRIGAPSRLLHRGGERCCAYRDLDWQPRPG